MCSRFASFRGVALGFTWLISFGASSLARADEPWSYDEAMAKDLAAWRELLRKGDYDALEKIGDELRTTKSKYPNGRGRLWRYAWTAVPENRKQAKDEDYAQPFE